jgi:hypothetical protein
MHRRKRRRPLDLLRAGASQRCDPNIDSDSIRRRPAHTFTSALETSHSAVNVGGLDPAH